MAEQDQVNDPIDSETIAKQLLEQQRLHKTVTWLVDKQEMGLSEADIRSTLLSIRMPNARVVRPSGGNVAYVSVGDSDPTDPILGADQDPRDPMMWRSDTDPTDPARRPTVF